MAIARVASLLRHGPVRNPMIDNPFDAFVGSRKPVPMYDAAEEGKAFAYLLWGDGVKFEGAPGTGGRRKVTARGRTGWVLASALDGTSLLEFYFIDVGQGDGVLVKTPSFQHILIDGGFPRDKQPSGKSAADFIDWKFVKDYGLSSVELDALISSHNDEDHYGGLSDLLGVDVTEELDAEAIHVDRFYHAGVSWWTVGGKRSLGEVVEHDGERYLVDLLDDRDSALQGLDAASPRPLQGEWAKFIRRVADTTTAEGGPCGFARLSDETPWLPGFDPDTGDVSIRVLAPIEAEVQGRAALRNLGRSELNTNGHSILLRVDYGRTRTPLTGDLNKGAQQDILHAMAGSLLELQCDVAKACHHGSADVSLAFLQAMAPSATIISSGDAEGHDHPRPAIVAASGATGHLTVVKDEIVTPLVYSTELARSYAVGKLDRIEVPGGAAVEGDDLARTTLHYRTTKAGDLRPKKGSRKAREAYVVSGLVYGLVNVRTDGETLLAATLDEKNAEWSVRTFPARF
jgi:beta-lactamase superfamily II metal-dependent hydrolase